LQISAVGLQVPDFRTQIVSIAAMEDRHLMSARRQPLNDFSTHELSAADDEDPHAAIMSRATGPYPGMGHESRRRR
jgi:hypothetical protein